MIGTDIIYTPEETETMERMLAAIKEHETRLINALKADSTLNDIKRDRLFNADPTRKMLIRHLENYHACCVPLQVIFVSDGDKKIIDIQKKD